MKSKQKSKELVNKFTDPVRWKLGQENVTQRAKECALIAVDEIMEFMRMDDEYTETASNANSKWVNYWVEVKQEINKL